MEWGKAKRFVVILLVLLNIVLAGLNHQQKQENTMTASQERAIFEVLSQNGITMYTDLLTEHAPMSRLKVEIPSYNKETLERLFFGSEKTTVTRKGTQTIYRGQDAVLTLEGAYGHWEKETIAMGKEDLTRGEAQRTAEKFMDGTEHFFGTYGEPMVIEEAEGLRVNFYGMYKRENVFSNYFSLLVTEGGIREITFNYCPVKGYSGEKQDISYSDEALLTFMREWKKKETKEEATIYRIELGYDQMENSTAAAGMAAISLEPCYRIYLMDEAEPYIINAYTCQIVNK
ncbi:two-component system regulatory protein YycI [Anaerotignum sp.]